MVVNRFFAGQTFPLSVFFASFQESRIVTQEDVRGAMASHREDIPSVSASVYTQKKMQSSKQVHIDAMEQPSTRLSFPASRVRNRSCR